MGFPVNIELLSAIYELIVFTRSRSGERQALNICRFHMNENPKANKKSLIAGYDTGRKSGTRFVTKSGAQQRIYIIGRFHLFAR